MSAGAKFWSDKPPDRTSATWRMEARLAACDWLHERARQLDAEGRPGTAAVYRQLGDDLAERDVAEAV